jgi:hypothetical protein
MITYLYLIFILFFILNTMLKLLRTMVLVTCISLVGGVFLNYPAYAESSCTDLNATQWNSQEQLEEKGFNFEFFGPEGSNSLHFVKEGGNHYAEFRLYAGTSPEYTTARVEDFVDDLRCWDPTQGTIVAEWTIRYTNPVSPSMTENMTLWNAPFKDNPDGTRTVVPVTAFGMTRSVMSGFQYAAVVAVNVDMATFEYDVLQIVPVSIVAPWLDATEWHTVRVEVSSAQASVYISQNGQEILLANATLPENWETNLGLELSSDNEFLPGVFLPPADTGFDVQSVVIHAGE